MKIGLLKKWEGGKNKKYKVCLGEKENIIFNKHWQKDRPKMISSYFFNPFFTNFI